MKTTLSKWLVLLGLATGALCLRPAMAQTPGGPFADVADSNGNARPVRSTSFPDVPRDHWAYDAVEQLRKMGILIGYPPEHAAKKAPVPTPRKPHSRNQRAR
jgi:hypothetical protein